MVQNGNNQMRRLGNTDLILPKLSFGAAPLGNLFSELSNEQVYNTLSTAWESGINYFDVAPEYGHGLAERRVGDFLRFKSKKEYIISTKVGRLLKSNSNYNNNGNKFINALPFDIKFDYSYDGVMRSFEHSLHRLGLAEIDIIYMHDLGQVEHGANHHKYFDIAVKGGFKALDELRTQKCIKAIGLGVKESAICKQSLEYLDFDCFMINGYFDLIDQSLIDDFLPECFNRNISIVYAGPFASGILATGAVKDAKYKYNTACKNILNKVFSIEEVCKVYNLPLATAAVQFPIHHPAVSTVVTGMKSSSEVIDNINNIKKEIPISFWDKLKQEGLLNSKCAFN